MSACPDCGGVGGKHDRYVHEPWDEPWRDDDVDDAPEPDDVADYWQREDEL